MAESFTSAPFPKTRDPAAWMALARNAFITGLVVLAPLGVTLWIINLLITSIGDPASKLFFGWLQLERSAATGYLLNIVSTVIVVVLITTLGFASRYLFGKWALRLTEGTLLRVPVAGIVYRTTKQIVDTFRSQKRAVFQKVVLLEFPRPGLYAIGFLTSTAEGEVQARTHEKVVNIFVPTTPNPTSGFLIMCPVKDLIELDMPVGDGMKLIISGGAVVPPYTAGPGQTQPLPLAQPAITAAPFNEAAPR